MKDDELNQSADIRADSRFNMSVGNARRVSPAFSSGMAFPLLANRTPRLVRLPQAGVCCTSLPGWVG
jgi:hypothetical protein